MIRLAALAAAAGVILWHPQAVFRSGVELVRVDVSVTRNHRPVAGLGRADFEVQDNGVRQQIDTVLYEAVPLDAYLVLDMSGSVAGTKIRDLRAAAHLFLEGLRPEDRAALVTFSYRVSLVRPLTRDLLGIELALNERVGAGSTALRDAVYATLRLRVPDARRAALVVFSDGVDNMSWLSVDDVVDAVVRSDVVVYGVVAGTGRKARPSDNPLLREATERSAGRLWKAEEGKLQNAFGEVLRDIHTRYIITYYPTGVSESGWHTLNVKLTHGRGDVLARPGYFRTR
jgi:VWFA-related protein